MGLTGLFNTSPGKELTLKPSRGILSTFSLLKGVFTRDRQPKAAAFRLKQLRASGAGTSMSPVMAVHDKETAP
jgi:hypothetical protein